MYILGLHNDEDSGVCLLKNGKIIDVVNEERISRKKLQSGFPKLSINYILKKNKITLKDINHFAYGWHGKQNDFSNYTSQVIKRLKYCDLKQPKILNLILERVKVEAKRDNTTFFKFKEIIKKLKIPKEKIHFFDHHNTHAWAAYSCSTFKNALVFTMDARGDLKSASVSVANSKKGLVELENNLSLDSLGFLYGQITHYLGYKPHRHEGKITGLAAYGNPKKTSKIFENLIKWDGNKILSNLGYYRPFFTNLSSKLKKDLKKHTREDIAAGLQNHCEKLVVNYVKYWIKKTCNNKKVNVCLAGGLFANVRINQKVKEIKQVKDLFVFPHMGDGGLPIGAACHLNFKITKKTKVDLKHVYYGQEYNNNFIRKELKKYRKKISFTYYKNIENQVVLLLKRKMVIGLFQGKMEFGPRALGSRSIIFNALDGASNDWLNKRLRRTEFMPFAPVTIAELAQDCYENINSNNLCAKFMTQTFNCKKSFIQKHPAVVHIDGTARPQLIKKKFNKIYYNIVKKYCSETGEKALINTSFNQHEEPIVCSPKDAINSLIGNNVDVLAIGNFIVKKND